MFSPLLKDITYLRVCLVNTLNFCILLIVMYILPLSQSFCSTNDEHINIQCVCLLQTNQMARVVQTWLKYWTTGNMPSCTRWRICWSTIMRLFYPIISGESCNLIRFCEPVWERSEAIWPCPSLNEYKGKLGSHGKKGNDYWSKNALIQTDR